ncbi:hypothetical protein V1509DRAFT_621324 [Lipomyces kononenkoae]
MLQGRPIYRLAVRYVARNCSPTWVNQSRFQRRMHASATRLRTDEEHEEEQEDDVVQTRSTSSVGENRPRSNDESSGKQVSVDQPAASRSTATTTAASSSVAPESTTTVADSSTFTAPDSALARLTTLALPWSVTTETKDEGGGQVSAIQKTFHFDTFEDAFMFMTRIAFYASNHHPHQHHPRMFNFWNRVRLTLGSYDNVRKVRTVSVMDVEMGTFAEKVYASLLDRRKDEVSGGSTSNDGKEKIIVDDDHDGDTARLSDILAEELNRRGSDSYSMMNVQTQEQPITGQEKRRAMVKALRKITKKMN